MANGDENDEFQRKLDAAVGDAAVQIVTCVAEAEGTDVVDLPNMYDCIGGVFDHVFTSPPSPDADFEIMFSYAGYRIAVEQDGTATFVPEN